jgi:hypothetical protein
VALAAAIRRGWVEGLLRDKTRPLGKRPIETVSKVLALTCGEPPGGMTHWTNFPV